MSYFRRIERTSEGGKNSK